MYLPKQFTPVVLGIIALMFSITSCSSDKVVSEGIIQKRKYNKGFYLNIRGNHHHPAPKVAARKAIPQKEIDPIHIRQLDNSEPYTASIGIPTTAVPIPAHQVQAGSASTIPIAVQVTPGKVAVDDVPQPTAVRSNQEENTHKQLPVHWAAITSFAVGLGGLLFGLIALKLAPTLTITYSVLGIASGVGALAMILGIIALKNLQHYPDAFRGENYATAGIAMGAVTILGVLYVLLAIKVILGFAKVFS